MQPGSGDLCFLSHESVERVLEYFNSVNIDVRAYSDYHGYGKPSNQR